MGLLEVWRPVWLRLVCEGRPRAVGPGLCMTQVPGFTHWVESRELAFDLGGRKVPPS
jgi:hypothetical protein